MRPAIYDLTKYPTTYDFAAWAVIARTHGVERVHFIIDGPIASWKYGADGEDVAWKRFATVLIPICKLARLKYSVGARMEGQQFAYHGGEVCRVYREMGRLEKLKPTVTWAKKDYVTITIRDSFRNTHRNSNFAAWNEFEAYLSGKNVNVMVIPECENAPFNVEHRMSWYWGADMNMGVAQGPMALCVFSDAPYITLNQNPKDTTGKAQYDIDKLLVKTGFPPGSQYDFRTSRQLLVWEPDSFDAIVRAYEGMQEAKEKAA